MAVVGIDFGSLHSKASWTFLCTDHADKSRLALQDTAESTLSQMKSQIAQPRTPVLSLLALTHLLQVSRCFRPKAARDRRVCKDPGDFKLQKHNRLTQTPYRRRRGRPASRIGREKIHQRRPCRFRGHSRRSGTPDPLDLLPISSHRTLQVNYVGERQVFSATQLVGMYLGKLRDTAAVELKTGVTDVVIAVPGWYSDVQRRAILDAASIASLNCLRLINDSTAVALGYGITKSDLPDPENPRRVAFVDVGHSTLSVAIVAFSKGRLDVISTAYDRNLGGRDIDYALLKHFAEEFKSKYKIDVLSNPKATFRLSAGCEKLKKILSANSEAPLSVESIMNDIDASSRLTRDQLESLIDDVLVRIEPVIHRAIADSGLTLDQIESVELVGGSTRVPAVRAKIQQAFAGKPLSFTLNQDEAVARGATFSCAMLSPVFRVREFHVHDITHYPIKVQWPPLDTDPDDETELIVFPTGNGIPSTKVLSFYRRKPFDVEAVYVDSAHGGDPLIAKFQATEVPVDPKGDPTVVKVKTRLNTHGVLSFESVYVEEIEEKEEPQPAPQQMDVDQPTPQDGSAAAPEAAPAAQQPPKKKRIVKKKEIPFTTSYKSLSKAVLDELREKENQMHAADKLVQDTEVSVVCPCSHKPRI